MTTQCLHDHLADIVRMKTVANESFFRCPFCRTERKGQVSCRMHLKRICSRFAPYGRWLDTYRGLLNVSEPERSTLAKKAQEDTVAAHDLRRQLDNHASQAPDPTAAVESSAVHVADQKRRLSMSSRITRSMHRDLPGCIFCFGHFETLEQYREHLCLAESGHYRDKSWCLQFVSTYENQDVAVRELKLAYQCLDKYPQKKSVCKVKAAEACKDGDGDNEDTEATKMEAGTSGCRPTQNNRSTAVFAPLILQTTSTVLSGASSLVSKKGNSALSEDSASVVSNTSGTSKTHAEHGLFPTSANEECSSREPSVVQQYGLSNGQPEIRGLLGESFRTAPRNDFCAPEDFALSRPVFDG